MAKTQPFPTLPPTTVPPYLIVGHSGAGKTTLVRALALHGVTVLDVDDVLTPELDRILKPLRARQAWQEHNALWLPAVAEFVLRHPSVPLAFHNFWVISQLWGSAADRTPAAVLLTDAPTLNFRLHLDEHRLQVATQNRRDVIRELGQVVGTERRVIVLQNIQADLVLDTILRFTKGVVS